MSRFFAGDPKAGAAGPSGDPPPAFSGADRLRPGQRPDHRFDLPGRGHAGLAPRRAPDLVVPGQLAAQRAARSQHHYGERNFLVCFLFVFSGCEPSTPRPVSGFGR